MWGSAGRMFQARGLMQRPREGNVSGTFEEQREAIVAGAVSKGERERRCQVTGTACLELPGPFGDLVLALSEPQEVSEQGGTRLIQVSRFPQTMGWGGNSETVRRLL